MQGYNYRLLDTRGRLFADVTFHSLSDDAACELGNELLCKCDCSALEIWRGTKLIYRVGKYASIQSRARH